MSPTRPLAHQLFNVGPQFTPAHARYIKYSSATPTHATEQIMTQAQARSSGILLNWMQRNIFIQLLWAGNLVYTWGRSLAMFDLIYGKF